MFTAWAALRLAKLVAVAAFGAGLWGALNQPSRLDRLRSVQRLATPAFVLTWLAGYGLMKSLGLKLSEPWILWGIATSWTALHAGFLAARKPAVSPVVRGLVVGLFLSALGMMVVRGFGPLFVVGALLVPIGAAVGAAMMGGRSDAEEVDRSAEVLRFFQVIAWMEGTSLLLLMGVVTPLKRIGGIHLDPDGYVGWLHGILVLTYLHALLDANAALRWGPARTFAGFVASLFPFGAFAFERLGVKRGG
jgi:integral membrane protein